MIKILVAQIVEQSTSKDKSLCVKRIYGILRANVYMYIYFYRYVCLHVYLGFYTCVYLLLFFSCLYVGLFVYR